MLGVFGLMGSGRSELARIIFGLDSCSAGRISANGQNVGSSPAKNIRSGLAFVTENRHQDGLLMDAAVEEAVELNQMVTPCSKSAELYRQRYALYSELYPKVISLLRRC